MAEQTQIEDDYLPLRNLNDLLYCERWCALHRIEEVWVENAHTLLGTLSYWQRFEEIPAQLAGGTE